MFCFKNTGFCFENPGICCHWHWQAGKVCRHLTPLLPSKWRLEQGESAGDLEVPKTDVRIVRLIIVRSVAPPAAPSVPPDPPENASLIPPNKPLKIRSLIFCLFLTRTFCRKTKGNINNKLIIFLKKACSKGCTWLDKNLINAARIEKDRQDSIIRKTAYIL